MDINTVKELIKLLNDENLSVLKIESDDIKVHLERDTNVSKGGSQKVVTNTPVERKETNTPADPSKYVEITAPQIGTFYTKKDEHSSENFVEIGDRIEVGDQIGYIEAMKMFNDLKSDVSGIVREIVVHNGEDVEYGDVLVRVEPEGN
ncbi:MULTISPECIES: acetyl-CoA carboxylase biotin carboxyl carrier protein subunit [unclassified Nosocomiicoccus]|uniref:acetyl-CoA carboxylase biotin carboxyl carrier protein n=2 Tax=Nosocomiicoccus TaxID=489909 RepID=UPI0008A21FF3|nr:MULTISPECIES: acetyl-CoA carboxylase biotin carboxyl carrier protein subunit [unclassified Nosocomiicoccus]OFL47297.1 hypothetical protein HMPREF2767_03850 [Nosocomiicoccus sp. HMSC067E10]OFS63099.1 hypothetical protein HMPREF3177_04150 [Nosocomiicoccus sp. HMSC09A07]